MCFWECLVVIPKVHILNDVTIGAGSTIIKNLGPGGVYVAVPQGES